MCCGTPICNQYPAISNPQFASGHMPLIIDGYNLLNATGISSRGRGPGNLERARQALLNTLVESLPADEVPRTTVVFDASESPWGVAKQDNASRHPSAIRRAR